MGQQLRARLKRKRRGRYIERKKVASKATKTVAKKK